MTHMVGQTVDLRIKTRQPFVLAEHHRCVTRRQFARQRRLAQGGFSANEVQCSYQPNLPSVDSLKPHYGIDRFGRTEILIRDRQLSFDGRC